MTRFSITRRFAPPGGPVCGSGYSGEKIKHRAANGCGGNSWARDWPRPPEERPFAEEKDAYFGGSWTLTMRSAATFLSSCVIPEGQRISTRSTVLLAPKPKWVGPALEEAYPAA